jgi:hypothetical protein
VAHVYALTVRQPWAALIVSGAKTVENRTWRAPERIIGERIAVHAAETRDADTHERADGDDVRGALVGLVVVSGCVDDSSSRWALPGHFHWLLDDAVRFAEPISCRGALGIWVVPFGPARAVALYAECGRLGQ